MTITTQNLLDHMAIPGMPGMFLLGCLERRITIYSQQLRALNLVHALFDRGLSAKHSRVAVIGGGVGGLTCAVAAARKGCRVTVLEKESGLLHLLEGSTSRWVHPRIYDWPHPDAKREDTDLPFMAWSATTAGQVAKRLRSQWDEHINQYLYPIEASTECRDLRYFAAGTEKYEWYLTWNSHGHKSESFDIVIWAVGFGVERTIPPLELQSYWRDDALHQTRLEGIGRSSFLVSGCGDGGLTDLFRLRLNQFDHFKVLRDLITYAEIDHVQGQLLEIEDAAQKLQNPIRQSEILKDGYSALQMNETLRWLEKQLRLDAMVTLNSQSRIPYNLASSILNRFLLACLLRVDAINYWIGEIKEIVKLDNGKYQVALVQTPQKLVRPECFDRIVIRHGATSPLEEWPEVWAACQVLRHRNVLDQTRQSLWNWDFWNVSGSRGTSSIPQLESLHTSVREIIDTLLPGEADLDAFILDYYGPIFQGMAGSSMTRATYVTRLFTYSSAEDVFDKLKHRFPDREDVLMRTPSQISDLTDEMIDENQLIKLLRNLDIGLQDLLSFLFDYFPNIYRNINSEMSRVEIIDLVRKSCEKEHLYTLLHHAFPREVALYKHPLRVPIPTTESLINFLQKILSGEDEEEKVRRIGILLRSVEYTSILLRYQKELPDAFQQHSRILVPALEPHRSVMRRLLARFLPTIPALNDFCQAHFHRARLQFTGGMDYMTRINLLFAQVPTSMILIRLLEAHPDAAPELSSSPD